MSRSSCSTVVSQSPISAARSRNIKFHLIIQGLYQLSSKYGADDAQTIKGNCGNWAFLTSRELPLLQEISDLCGADAQTGERLISVSQLQRLNKWTGEVLILLGRQFPYLAHLADISDYVLPSSCLRPYPRIAQGEIPVRTPKGIIAMMHALDSRRDATFRNAVANMIGIDDHDNNPNESSCDVADLQAELERRFAELFGSDDDTDDEDDETI